MSKPNPFDGQYDDAPPHTDADQPEPTLSAEEQFAQEFLSGRATDSMGNDVHGNNVDWPSRGSVSLVGPPESTDNPPGTKKARQAGCTWSGLPIVPGLAPPDSGMTDEEYYLVEYEKDAKRGIRGPLRGQALKEARDRAILKAAWPKFDKGGRK